MGPSETNGKRKRGRPKGVKNSVKTEEDCWTPEIKKCKSEQIEIKNAENDILSKSLRNKAESVDLQIDDQTNVADAVCEASEEVDD